MDEHLGHHFHGPRAPARWRRLRSRHVFAARDAVHGKRPRINGQIRDSTERHLTGDPRLHLPQCAKALVRSWEVTRRRIQASFTADATAANRDLG